MVKKTLTGWSKGGRKFTKEEFKKSFLSQNLNFDSYSTAFDRQSKNPRLKKTL